MDELALKRFQRKLQQKLSRTEVTENLVSAGLFLLVYELLKGEIVENTRRFFIEDIEKGKEKYSPLYASDVLALHKDIFRASCAWLVSAGAISDTDAENALKIREHRHTVAHELPTLLFDPDAEISRELFLEAQRLLVALGKFWGRMHIESDSQFDGQEIKDEDIQSGAMVLMGCILRTISKDNA